LPQEQRSPSRTDILRFIAVDAEAPLPLAAQLRQQLAWLIASGQLKGGERLPPVREVASYLGINRNTVRAAGYDVSFARIPRVDHLAIASGSVPETVGAIADLMHH
jgi:hypothetical protein